MKNKDGELIYNSIINKGIIPLIGNGEWLKEVKKIEYLEYEHLGPDSIFITEKIIYGVEHFYVDASKMNKKGNALKTEYSRIIKTKIIPNIEKDLENNNVISNSYKFKSPLSYENLKNNIYANFENHYKNIMKYEENIINKYGNKKNIEIIFFIEFNILPSIYVVNGKPEKEVYPFMDIDFLKYFVDKRNIKGLIFSINKGNFYIPIKDKYIIDNKNIFDFSNGNIEDYKMNQITTGIKLLKK